ncbi:hypothetical protein [Micromonospora sp. NPDC048063]|uniref:hypothetical protein n=1 Tax=Micromonospora sp. NPDC048063 TaxID=3364256 RepID=UPI00371B4B09
MRPELSRGEAARASTVDTRRRVTLPTPLADAAGITGGPVVVVRGDRPGELVLATPAAALERLRANLAAALATHSTYPSLTAALHRQPAGRPPAPTPVDLPPQLPDEGPLVCDTAPLLALLDGDPAAEALVALLPRVIITDAVAEELLETMIAAGLPIEGVEQPCSYAGVCDVLAALGVRSPRLESGGWAPLRIIGFALTRAGVTAAGERSTLALARHLGATALIGRPAGDLPPDAAVHAVDARDLALADTPAQA